MRDLPLPFSVLAACAGMTRAWRLSACAAALLLAGCAADGEQDGGTGFAFGNVATDSLSSYYSPSTVSYAVRDGTMPTVVIGNPFTGPEEPVDEIVRNAARMPGWTPNTRFVADANADAGKGHRVVVVLNPANQNLSPNAMCSVDPMATVTGGSYMVRTAFCQDALPLSTASIRRAAPAGRNDPAFAQTVAQAVNLLFPFVEQRTISVQ
jgi:hypothetical protein